MNSSSEDKEILQSVQSVEWQINLEQQLVQQKQNDTVPSQVDEEEDYSEEPFEEEPVSEMPDT